MSIRIAEQDRSYRRGLLLGFTIAEIFLLLTFVFLLALASILLLKEKEIKKLAEQLNRAGEQQIEKVALEKENTQLKEMLKKFDQDGSPEKFDDFFNELRKRELLIARQEKELSSLTEKLKKSEKDRQMEIQKHGSLLEKVRQAEQGISEKDKQLKETEKEIASLKARMGRTQAENVNLKRITGGKGTEHPACWASQETGKPEYIFDTTLTSNGIIVKDNALPHRAAEQAQLPLSGVIYGQEVSVRTFTEITKPLFRWSEKEECRFFVRVHDKTLAYEKDVYKRHLRYVQQHFYTFEDI